MSLWVFRKYRDLIFISAIFFYMGYFFTISLLPLDCANTLAEVEVSTSTNHYEYVVLIISGPDNEVKREAIRGTWAKLTSNIIVQNSKKIYRWNHSWSGVKALPKLIQLYFVIGIKNMNHNKVLKLKNEHNRANDLLLFENLEDSYKNLSLKILTALQWVNSNIKDLKYLIKCDDDSFVRIDLIVKNLEAYAPEMNAPELKRMVTYKMTSLPYRGLYWGYFNGVAKVYMTGKWEEKDWFLCDRYLPYALGGGYVISHSIVEYIARNAELLSLYNAEDVSMGVWTAPLKGINRVHDIRFDTEWKSRGCSKDTLIRHKQTSSDIFGLYKTLVSTHGETLCESEIIERFAYLYNWSGLPSQCCKEQYHPQ